MQKGEVTTGKAIRSTEAAKSIGKLMKEWYARAREAGSRGRRVAWAKGVPIELFLAFDVEPIAPENFSGACAAKQVAVGFIEAAEADGYTKDTCSYATNTLGYCRLIKDSGTLPPEVPAGGMSKPDMLVTSTHGCDAGIKWWQAMATRFWSNVPIHMMDWQSPPYGTDINDPRIKEHYTGHMERELIELVVFLEKHTGKKLDAARLSEVLEKSYKAQRLVCEIEELRKTVPSPMPSEDYFTCIPPLLFMIGGQEVIGFYQGLYDEVKYRVEHGIGVIPDEKHRLMWVGIPPWYNLGVFNFLESLGAVSVRETQYYVGNPPKVDTSNPLRALAERAWLRAIEHLELGGENITDTASPLAVLGLTPVGLVTKFARDYQIDGIIMHNTLSCRIVPFGQAHIRNVLPRYLDIPVTFFESDMSDPRSWHDVRIKMQLEAFIEMVAARKERRVRQP